MIRTMQIINIQILRKSNQNHMIKIHKFLNGVSQVIVNKPVNQKFYLFCQIIIYLQAILYVNTSFSMVHTLTQWSDISNFQQPPKIVIFSFILIIFSTVSIVGKIFFIENRTLTEKPSFFKIYLIRIISYLQMIISSLFLAPLIRATSIIYVDDGSPPLLYIGVISIIVAFILIYPMYLASQSSRLAMVSYRGKLCSLNLQFYFDLLRVILPGASVVSQKLLIVLAFLFIILHAYFSWYYPVLSYRHNNIKQIMMSAITYTCLCKLQNLIDQNSYNNPFIWILGCISFCFMTSSLRSHRVRQILAQKEFTLKKTKILIFLIYNIEQYNEILLAYLLLHHKQCQQAVCYCQNVRSTLYQKEQVNFKQLQKEWYKLVVHFIQSQYNTNKIQALNESSRLLTLKQYTEIALNLSEIHLFKLQQINKSYYILDQYSDICENNRLLSYMSKLEVSILKRQIQEKRRIKSLTKGKMSSKIEQYIRFQVYYQQLKLKMKQSCQKVSLFWVQTLKKEPDQSKIIDILHSVFEQNEKIETSHKHMLLAFSNCQQIIAKALNQYYIHILNIPSDSPFHINRNFTFAKAAVQKKQINARVFQNSDYFGYNSQTPLCFISVDRQNFGEILRYNQFFDRLMKVQYRNCLKIQDLLIPQMRFGHQRKMEAYLKDDNYKLQHNHGITFNKDGYLVYHKIILQNVPSIQNGLKYVVLFKKTCQEKKIFALKNKQNIIYTSQKLVKNCGEGYIKQLKAGLQNNSFYSQLVTTKQSRIKIEGRDEKLLFLSQFNDKENSWLIIEIHEEMNNNQMYTKSTFSQANYLEQQADKAFKFITNYMQDSSQNTHIQNSLVAKENNKRNTLSQSTELQCSDKLQQEMNEAFKILTASTQNGVIKRTIKVYFISGVIILVIIGLSGYLKQQEIKSYELLANTNRAYHKLMLNLNGVAIYSRIITYFSYLNLNIYSTQILFANFISFSQIIASLDDVVKNFNIQQILQDWPAFNCNKKQGTITETKQNNMLSIADFIQNPVTNLISASDYQFSMDKNNTIIPFTTTQCNYFQLILNVQYVTIPNLRKLKKDRLNSLLISSIQMSPFQIFLFSFAITIIFLFLILMHVFKNIILIAKHVIFDIYQKTDCLFRKNRLDRCQYYLMKNQIKCKSTKNSDVLAEPDENEESSEFQSAISKEIVTEQQGGREVNNQIIYLKQQKTKDSQLNLSQQEYFAKKKDLGIIKSMMFAIPIACCFSSFYYLQFKQAKDIKNALMIQDKLQIMQQNYNFVKIYAMQYVFEQASFQRYLNSRNYINTLAQEIFQIQRNFVDKSEDLSLLPNLAILIEEMAFSNLCDSPLFELRSIPNLCPVVGGGILTKGLYSTIINYVEQAENLLNLHTNVGNYTFSQKIKYLGSPFFNDGVITIFIDEIFTLLLAEFSSDFKSIGQTKIINYITILLIIATYCLIFGVVNAISTVKDMKKHLRQIKIVTILISLDSFKKDSTLKTLFSNSFEKFDKLN